MRRHSPAYYSPPRREYSPPRREYGGRGRSPPRRRYGGGPSGGNEGSRSLLVRNIPLNCRPDDLRMQFERFGKVRDVYLPKDYYSGEPRGFAFVEFMDPYDAMEAQYHMNGQRFGGREITVVVASENRKRPDDMRHRAKVSEPSRHGGHRSSSGYGRPRSRSRSPHYRTSSRARHTSRSYFPVPRRQIDHHSALPRRHADYSASPRKPIEHGKSTRQNSEGLDEKYNRRSRSPGYDEENRNGINNGLTSSRLQASSMTSYSRLFKNLRDSAIDNDRPAKRLKKSNLEFAPINETKLTIPFAPDDITILTVAPNADQDTRARAAAVLFRAINEEPTLEGTFENYLSFLRLMIPDIGHHIDVALDYAGYRVTHLEYPDTGMYRQYDNVDTPVLNVSLAMIYLGCSLLIPFKTITVENYEGYFDRRLAALCNLLGGDPSTVRRPFSPQKCEHIKRRLSQFEGVRRGIVSYFISPTARSMTLMSTVVRYNTLMIAWAEMTGFFFVLEGILAPVSPVLFVMEVRNEVSRFLDIAEQVFSTDHPPLYKFLAQPEQSTALERSQYPTLYAVAYTILRKRHTSVRQLVGPANIGSDLVKDLVRLHEAQMKTNPAITDQVERWIPDLIDPDMKYMKNQMDKLGLSAKDDMAFKAFSQSGYTSASVSGVEESNET